MGVIESSIGTLAVSGPRLAARQNGKNGGVRLVIHEALIPGIGRCAFAAITAVIALWGLIRAAMSTLGIGRFTKVHWTDVWFYGIYPCAIYLAMGVVAIAFWRNWSWARDGLAVVITFGLLLAIRNEWDLITWITPRGEDGEQGEELQ